MRACSPPPRTRTPCIAAAGARSIPRQVIPNKRSVAALRCCEDVGFAFCAGDSSILRPRSERAQCSRRRCHAARGPENHPAFAVERVTHRERACTGSKRRTAAQRETLRSPLQSHLHSAHATPRNAVHHTPAPNPRRDEGQAHEGGGSDDLLACGGHTAEHSARWSAGRNVGQNAAQGRRQDLPMAFAVWRSLREEPHLCLDELERALDLRALFRGWQRISVGVEDKR